ncbi:phage tail tape measure protein [Streptomyces sp. NPDC005774]|uniref:phage tail tape measure protein n=1 Tax=Streptomyces sp. NPDC005774 TaxID=3364728 RepID=UPI003688C6B0
MPRAGAVWVDVLPNMSGFGRSLNQQIGEPVAQASQSAGEAGGESMMSGMKAAVAAGAIAVGAAAGALVVKGLETSLAKGKAAATIKGQLDISAQDAKKAGEVAGKLWSSSVTETIEEGAEAVKLVLGSGLVDSSASTKEIGKISTAVSDLATLFDQDVTMATKAAASMVKSGFAKDGTEAVDAMTYGFQNLGVKAEDLAETFNEYSPFMKNFGLDAKDALGLMSQGLDAGAWDTDKIGDSFKELYLRITGGDQAVKDALSSIGLGGSGVMKAIADGGPGARKALDQILDGLRKVPDETTKAQAVQDLFGGPGEDLGASIFSLNVDTASKKIGNFSGATKKAGDSLRSDVGTQFETFKRKSLMAIGDALSTHVLPKLMDFGRFLHSDVLPKVKDFAGFVDTYVVPVVKTLGEIVGGTIRWFKDWGIWLTPLAVLIGGVTLALNAQAIATGFVTAVFSVYRAAILVGTAVTSGFAAAQAVLNAVMALNPFTLIAIALVALGVALVVAWKKSETFRNIVLGAWEAIKTGAMWLWTNGIKPLVDGFMAGMRTLGQWVSWLWGVLSPVFSAIATGAKLLATILITIVFTPVYLYVKVMGAIFKWLWSAAIKPVFGWIVAGAKLWWSGVKLYFSALMTGVRAIGSVFKWLWTNGVKPVFGWIVAGAKLWWSGVKLYFGYLSTGVRAVGAVFKWLYNSGVKPAFNSIKSVISTVYNSGIRPVFDRLKSATKSVAGAFDVARGGIKAAWDKVKGIAKTPVKFIIDTVYNGGIVKVWNAVAGKFGAPKLDAIKGFARGGVLPGMSSYRDGDDQLVPMRRGEGVAVSEAMRDPYERRRLLAVNAAAMRGQSLRPFQGEGFAKGGIFGWVKNAASKGVDLAKSGVGWLKDGIKNSAVAGLNAVVKPLINKISGSASVYRDMVTGIPQRMIKTIVGYSGDADKEMEKAGIGGKGFKSALAWARTQAGKAYQWGGNGNPSWDCSGFVSAIESVIRGQSPHRRWATGAFSGATAPGGWVLNKRSPYQIGITNAGVGHTAGTINGVNVESRGGDGVVVGSRARSYRDSMFTHRYGFAAKGYADGGKPRAGEVAWVGEQGPELVRFKGGEEVYNHAESLRMWEGIGARGFAKGTASSRAKARKDIPGDLTNFTKSLTGSAAAIAKASKELTKDLKAAGIGSKGFIASVNSASKRLQTMATLRDGLGKRIAAARQAADDQRKSATDYLGMSQVGEITDFNGLLSSMKTRQADLKTFQAQIAGLAKKGLSQNLIGQLVEQGPGGPLIDMLSRASKAQIKQLDTVYVSGSRLATSYGRSIADSLHDAGKDAAKGFLAGLIAQEKEVKAAMAKLGASAVKAIRSKKGIDARSPSRKGAEAGKDLGAGLVAGMVAAGPSIESAAARLGASAVPAGVVPVTSGASSGGASGGLPSGPLYLVVEDGTVLRAYVSDRVDAGLEDVRRAKRSGSKR